MEVTFTLFGIHREKAGTKTHSVQLEHDARVQDALDALVEDIALLEGYLFDESGRLREDVVVMVEGENISHKQGVATALDAESELHIVHQIHGG
jgi:molybdopterin synthase sulfur carrier subunit